MYAVAPQFGRDAALVPYEYSDPGLAHWNADIATDGDGYLATWTDTRYGGYTGSVWAARLAADGTLLDKTGIRLGHGNTTAVVWTGASYVVAWRTTEGVYAARVSSDGVVSDTRLVIEALPGSDLALATTGTTIAVMISGGSLALLNLDLSVVARHALEPGRLQQNTVSVAAGRSRYLLAYVAASGAVITQTLDENGVLGDRRSIVASSVNMVSVASDGTSYFVLWTTLGGDLRGQLGSGTNDVRGEPRTLVSTGPVNGSAARLVQSPHVMWIGGEYLATYFTGGTFTPQDASALTISRDGRPAGSSSRFGVAHGVDHANVAAKSNGSGALIWTDAQFRVRVGLFDATSIASRNPFRNVVSAANTARLQNAPAVVSDERSAVVAWIERSSDVHQVRIARAGRAPIVVANGNASRLWLTYDGETVTVLWQDEQSAELGAELNVRRYTRTLEPIDPSPLRIQQPIPGIIESAAAANGTIALTSSRPDEADVFFTRLIPNGGELSVQSVRLTPDHDRNVADDSSVVMWDGSRFAVVWRRHTFASFPGNMNLHDMIYGAYVTGDGLVSAPELTYEMFGGAVMTLRAAARDGKVVIAWQEALFGLPPSVMTTYVAPWEGSPVTRRRVLSVSETVVIDRLQDVEIHAGGKIDLFWMRWLEDRSQASIRAMRLSPALIAEGDPYVSETFNVPLPDESWTPSKRADFDATIAGDQALMVYVRRDDSPQAGSVGRIFIRAEPPQAVKRRAVR